MTHRTYTCNPQHPTSFHLNLASFHNRSLFLLITRQLSAPPQLLASRPTSFNLNRRTAALFPITRQSLYHRVRYLFHASSSYLYPRSTKRRAPLRLYLLKSTFSILATSGCISLKKIVQLRLGSFIFHDFPLLYSHSQFGLTAKNILH